MRRTRRRAVAAAVLIICTVIAVTSSPASAAPALTVTPNTGLTNGQVVAVSGTGFAPNSAGGVIQCSTAVGQPTISVLGNNVPVSCSNPLAGLATSNASGVLSLPSFTVKTGTVGPPAAGTDSSGTSAATSAALYPCPPTQAQIDAGATCVIAYGNLAGEQVQAPITFAGQPTGSSSTTDGSSSSSSTSSSSTTSSTTSSSTTTSTPPDDTPSLAVEPSTDLEDGQKVIVTGSGFTPGLGSLIQCSGDPEQPTVSALGNDVPVSCTDPLLLLVSADANGDIPPTEVTVHTGTVGPPAAGKDSNGDDAAGSAASYPCPPTQAQVDAGVSCVIAYGNLAGEQATADISFTGEPLPPTEPTVLGESETAGEETLPKTGLGSGMLRMTAIALALLNLGYLALSSTWTDRLRKGGRQRSDR